MSRKKEIENQSTQIAPSAGATAVAEPESKGAARAASADTAAPANGENPEGGEAKVWGNPYKAIFVSKAKGFEMGENRRFKQRVFIFTDKPDQTIIDTLKENGFVWRMGEKAWTIEANPATRAISDQLAREFAGQEQDQGMSR